MSCRLEWLMESGSFSAILCLAKNIGSILFQNANKARHPPFRFIYHSISSQSTPNSLWRTSFSGFPWISPASFLKMSVAFFFSFVFCLSAHNSLLRKKEKKFHPSLSSQDSSHAFHLPACGQRKGSCCFICFPPKCRSISPAWPVAVAQLSLTEIFI